MKLVSSVIWESRICLSRQSWALFAILDAVLLIMCNISAVIFGGGGGDKIIVTLTTYKVIKLLINGDFVGGLVGLDER